MEVNGVPLGSFDITSINSNTSTSLVVNFNSAVGANSYTVKYGTSSGAYTVTASTSATSPYTITGLNAGTNYYVMVLANNASGSVSATAEVSATTAIDSIAMSSLAISNIIENGFDVSVNFSGDNNNNASVSVVYCNETINSGCDPTDSANWGWLSTETPMVRGSGKYTLSVSGLSPINYNAGDVITLALKVSDADGVTGISTFMFNLKSNNKVKFSNFSTNIHEKYFDAMVDYGMDTNNDAVLVLNYCNATSSPSCDPNGGTGVTSVSLTKFKTIKTFKGHITPSDGAAGRIMNFALYADATDSHYVIADYYHWITDKDHYFKIYTPNLSSEVGVSQRPMETIVVQVIKSIRPWSLIYII